MPESVRKIGYRAFANCRRLKAIKIPSKVKELEEGLFDDCKKLREVILQEGLRIIGNRTFEKCESLREIVIPETVIKIGENPFVGCKSLRKIDCKSNRYFVENDALYHKKSKTLICCFTHKHEFIIPAWVKAIGKYAFAGNRSLRKVYIPEHISEIPDYAFYECFNLNIQYSQGYFRILQDCILEVLSKPTASILLHLK